MAKYFWRMTTALPELGRYMAPDYYDPDEPLPPAEVWLEARSAPVLVAYRDGEEICYTVATYSEIINGLGERSHAWQAQIKTTAFELKPILWAYFEEPGQKTIESAEKEEVYDTDYVDLSELVERSANNE